MKQFVTFEFSIYGLRLGES